MKDPRAAFRAAGDGRGLQAVTWQGAHIAAAEVAGLMHVNPQAVKRQLAVQVLDLRCPPVNGLLRKEVWEVHSARPQLQDISQIPHKHLHSTSAD
jgi:hypothetical protein